MYHPSLQHRYQSYLVRQTRTRREGSEPFVYSPAVLNGGERVDIDIGEQWPQSKKYAPLDYAQVTNNGVVDIEITINQQDTWFVPAGIITEIKGRPVHAFSVKNLHASSETAAGKIKVVVMRQPITLDQMARNPNIRPKDKG